MPEWNRVYEENKMKKTFIVTDEFLGNLRQTLQAWE